MGTRYWHKTPHDTPYLLWQWMYTFVKYVTFATTHDLVSWLLFLNWDENSEYNVESLIMILSSPSLASLSSPSIVALIRLLWISLTDTCNNNFGISCGSMRPSILHLQKIIDNWWVHNLWMMHNQIIKGLLYLFINFWITFLLLFQCPWFISKFNCLVLRVSSSN